MYIFLIIAYGQMGIPYYVIVLVRRSGVYPRPIKRVDRNGWRTLLLPVIFLGADKETFIRREVIYLR